MQLLFNFRLVGCENAIGIMTKLQTSLAHEETWVDGATEKLTALPTATSAFELDVSTNPSHTSSSTQTQIIALSLSLLHQTTKTHYTFILCQKKNKLFSSLHLI